jgi:hypothetical protein
VIDRTFVDAAPVAAAAEAAADEAALVFACGSPNEYAESGLFVPAALVTAAADPAGDVRCGVCFCCFFDDRNRMVPKKCVIGTRGATTATQDELICVNVNGR